MFYPTKAEVCAASREQLARWHRFLPSPGSNAFDAQLPGRSYDAVVEDEMNIMADICARFEELGGWSPELSKSIGHNPPQ